MGEAEERKRIEEYAELVKQKSRQGYTFLIYGAGRMAGNLYELMEQNGIEIAAFCVTDKWSNKKIFNNKQVYGIGELPFRKENICMLFGVNQKYNQDLTECCMQYEIHNYVKAPEWLPSYGNNISAIYINNPVLQVTTRIGCPVNCKYCPQELFVKKYSAHSRVNEMSLETFKICLDKTPDHTIVQFAGFSEAFLNPQCIDMVLYAGEQGRKIVIDSTLMGFTQEIFQKLSSVSLFEFVLHIADRDMNARIPLTEEYIQKLEYVFHATKKNGMPLIDYANCQGVPHERVVGLADGKIEIFTALHDRAGNLKEDGLMRKKDLYGPLRCELMTELNHWVLLPDGTVLLCDSDWGMENILGNLYTQSYEEIINGKELSEIKRKIQSETDTTLICRNCAHALPIEQ